MRRSALPSLALALGLFVLDESAAPAADAVPERTPEAKTKAAALVRRLGDDSFEVRETAYKELEKLGKSVQKELEEGVKDYDPEVSSRARRLLALATRTEMEVALDAFLANRDDKQILKLPTWERFSKLAGKDNAARTLFVEMYTSEGALLATLDKDPKGFDKLFSERCQQIQQTLYTPWGQVGNVSVGQVTALLFAATDPRVTITNVNSFYMITNMLYQHNIQQGFKSSPASKKVLAEFIDRRSSDQNTLPQALQIALQLELKEVVPTAVKAAAKKDTQAWTRATALMVVGKMGGKEDMAVVEPLLSDTTNLGAMQFNQTRINTEMRDVALAALIQLSGQQVTDYDFPYLKLIKLAPNQQYYYNYFGFSDDTQRQAAIKKFKDSQEKNKKK